MIPASTGSDPFVFHSRLIGPSLRTALDSITVYGPGVLCVVFGPGDVWNFKKTRVNWQHVTERWFNDCGARNCDGERARRITVCPRATTYNVRTWRETCGSFILKLCECAQWGWIPNSCKNNFIKNLTHEGILGYCSSFYYIVTHYLFMHLLSLKTGCPEKCWQIQTVTLGEA